MFVYPSTVIEHYKHPRNMGSLHSADGQGYARAADGCEVRFQVRLSADDRVEAVRFRSTTCVVAVAACSILSTLSEGRPAREVAGISADDVARALGGVPPERQSRCEMAVSTLGRALEDAWK
ncbi:MAG TPA: hypothetical protein DCP20_04880 [Coriobacteriia bacterium]|nr:hypothetical protein [Coriobacteriia bacterium]